MLFIFVVMKKIIILFLELILLVSCDPARFYDYYITNNCNEVINVKIEACSLNCGTQYAHKYEILNIQIESNTTQLILSDTYFQPLDNRMVEYFFKNIIITKENVTSKINYVNKDLWVFKKVAKFHAESYLTVKSEDFE